MANQNQMSDYNDLRNSTLINTLVDKISAHNSEHNADAKKLKSHEIDAISNELIRRLSNPNLSEAADSDLLAILNSQQISHGIKTQIEGGLLNRYQGMYTKLLDTTQLVAEKIHQDYEKHFNERLNTVVNNTDFFDHFDSRSPERLNALMMEGTPEKKRDQSAMDDWENRLGCQAVCIAKIRRELLPLDLGDSWQRCRDKVISAIRVLPETLKNDEKESFTNPRGSATMERESSPIFRAFKDVINSISEALGLSPVFDKSKVQLFKDTLDKVKHTLKIEEATEEESHGVKNKI